MTTTRQTNQGDDRSSIEAILKSYETALNLSDADAALSLYGTNPVFMPPNSQPVVGREAVRRIFEQASRSNRGLSPRFTIHEIEKSGDLAWARVSAELRVRNKATGNESEVGSNQLYLLRREDGVWKIHCYMFSPVAK